MMKVEQRLICIIAPAIQFLFFSHSALWEWAEWWKKRELTAIGAFRRKKFIDFDWMEMKSINQLNLLKAERATCCGGIWLRKKNEFGLPFFWWVMAGLPAMAPPKGRERNQTNSFNWSTAKKGSADGGSQTTFMNQLKIDEWICWRCLLHQTERQGGRPPR